MTVNVDDLRRRTVVTTEDDNNVTILYGGPQGPKGDPGGLMGNIAINEVPAGTKNGSNKTFTLAHTPVGQILLSWNGQIMTPGVGNDYTLSGTTITLLATVGPASSDVLLAFYPY
jgi:hypothetical protein